jgi:hypothetical protein
MARYTVMARATVEVPDTWTEQTRKFIENDLRNVIVRTLEGISPTNTLVVLVPDPDTGAAQRYSGLTKFDPHVVRLPDFPCEYAQPHVEHRHISHIGLSVCGGVE